MNFQRRPGLEQADPRYFYTAQRWRELQEFSAPGPQSTRAGGVSRRTWPMGLHGTVGAVALDRSGHLAAATSTGGLTGKRWDGSAIPPSSGAGTYAR